MLDAPDNLFIETEFYLEYIKYIFISFFNAKWDRMFP